MYTTTNINGFVGKFLAHAAVENIQGAFPQTIIPESFAVFVDAAIDLIDILKTMFFHEHADHFAANTTGAISDYRLVLYGVVLGVL